MSEYWCYGLEDGDSVETENVILSDNANKFFRKIYEEPTNLVEMGSNFEDVL